MSRTVINDYANSMFRFERLHPRWIDRCASYLKYVFGDAIKGKVFLDYAFGRGNWSLAALKAGAKAVISIDAAAGNVQRLSDYCRSNNINAIEIIHGNILSDCLDRHADLLWVYGILPCISDRDSFVAKLADLRLNNNALAFFYEYDRYSLRQAIVDAARLGCIYESEEEFSGDSYLFTPRARLRVRDDLTAPVVNWSTAAELADLVTRNGYTFKHQFQDFRDWLTDSRSQEFSPHHLLCSFSGESLDQVTEPVRPLSDDFALLSDMASILMEHATPDQRRKLAIGLCNTHFSALPADGSVEPAVIEDFLFLMHAVLRLEIPSDAFNGRSATFRAAAIAAMSDRARNLPPELLATSAIASYLTTSTLRF